MEYPPAFAFSITEAVTTPCVREQEARHIADLAMRDPMMMAAGLTKGRKGIVLLSGPMEKSYPSLAGETWQFHTLPTQPAVWLCWLTSVDADGLATPEACTAG